MRYTAAYHHRQENACLKEDIGILLWRFRWRKRSDEARAHAMLIKDIAFSRRSPFHLSAGRIEDADVIVVARL